MTPEKQTEIKIFVREIIHEKIPLNKAKFSIENLLFEVLYNSYSKLHIRCKKMYPM